MRMGLPRLSLSLPLLARELSEQAARRRTYVLRVIYALIIFGYGGTVLRDLYMRYRQSPLGILGQGDGIFEYLLLTQLYLIYLLLPALTCGVLTREKEQRTLALLFLTRLGPLTILIEKLLSRLVPMWTLLLLTLPLLAVTYTMGGISQSHLAAGICTLVLASVQIASLSLMCSAWCRTTAGSIITTYTLLIFAFVEYLVDLIPFLQFDLLLLDPMFLYGASSVSLLDVLSENLWIPTSSLVFLVFARIFLLRRAFLGRRSLLVKLLAPVDWRLARGLRLISRGKLLLRADSSLPQEKPIAWRETTRRFTGSHESYICSGITAVVLLCLLLVAAGGDVEEWAIVFFMFVGFAALCICVKSASLFASERADQTLEILLTSPLSNHELLEQKYFAVRRMMRAFLMPLAALVFFNACLKVSTPPRFRVIEEDVYHLQGVATVATLLIYAPMLSWISVLVGLLVRSQARAILAALLLFFAWNIALPCMLIYALEEFEQPLTLILLSSPMPFLVMSAIEEVDGMGGFATYELFIANCLIYVAVWAISRRMCFFKVSRYLGRVD